MIYTVTFNPSLDYVVKVEDFKLGVVNRTESEEIFEGGKGINVSIVLKNLGIDSVALGFVAGFTGQEIERGVKNQGCNSDFIQLKNGLSRINVKLKAKVESEINAQGPQIGTDDLEKLYSQLELLKEGDFLVLSGSIPNTLPEDIYEKIIEHLSGKNIHFVVDATKDLLRKVLKYHPFLIKPNNYELGEMFDLMLDTREDIITCAKKLQEEGAINVLVSMAGDGAILISEMGRVYTSKAPKGEVINSVGAGDAMVAGFLAGYITSGNLEDAFKMGVAAGSASAFSDKLATKEEVIQLLNIF
jgi:1-phosphofructokinase